MTSPEEIRKLSEKLGIDHQTLISSVSTWKDSPVRAILMNRCEEAIESERTTLETIDPEDLKECQGRIKGIRRMLGIIKETSIKK